MVRTTTDSERRVVRPPQPGVFSPGELDGLPEPVLRYLNAAVAPGTPLARTARIRMHGTIRIGRWLPFRAHEVISPHTGFVWSARAGAVITGSDRYVDGVGLADWRLAGLVPVMHAEGRDVTLSAAGRSGGEAVWVPTTLLPRFGVSWTAESDRCITAGFAVGDAPIALSTCGSTPVAAPCPSSSRGGVTRRAPASGTGTRSAATSPSTGLIAA